MSVQVPVYNEKYVIEGLLQALAELNYPKHLFEVQVLDDSTDETIDIIDRKVAETRTQGFSFSVLRRQTRKGYKAGALAHGLANCKGDLVAIFDADFRPQPNFILSLLSHFDDGSVGSVQARWGHLNGDQNFLTRIQAGLLNMHFKIEQEGRYKAGYFNNFCGTAGIWRKQCIADAGGWDGDILSEDLDLSYRAQLKGWRIVYDNNVVVAAQLPAGVEAFKIQQFRWTKGIAQTAKKTLKNLWRQRLPPAKKLHGVFHLLDSLTFVCLLANGLLTLPLLQLRHQYPLFINLTNYTAIGVTNLIALGYLCYASTEPGATKNFRFIKMYPLFVVVYLAMSVQNAVAVLQGLAGMPSPFVRTPKFESKSSHSRVTKFSWILLLEAGLLIYFIYGIGLCFYYSDYFFLLFFMLMCCGLIILLYPFVLTLLTKNFDLQKQLLHKLKKAFLL
ncbi:MAG TPA: glycosyltransferase [Flavisolibacter sp.]|nr:glycosyltransferase [Flavisolibacter sp.]